MQASADNKKIPSDLSWDSLNSEITADGSPVIDFDRFSKRYDQDPKLQSIVDKFDKDGLTLKTQEKKPEIFKQREESKLAKIAKRATKLGK